MIKIISPNINNDRIVVEHTTIEELTDLILKYEALAQSTTVQYDIAAQRTSELHCQLRDQRAIVEDGYVKLRSHLETMAVRQRHGG